MSATRTQIYLTGEQRRRLDARARREDRSMASLIREAVDRFLQDEPPAASDALASTFGSCPELLAPDRAEWDRLVG